MPVAASLAKGCLVCCRSGRVGTRNSWDRRLYRSLPPGAPCAGTQLDSRQTVITGKCRRCRPE